MKCSWNWITEESSNRWNVLETEQQMREATDWNVLETEKQRKAATDEMFLKLKNRGEQQQMKCSWNWKTEESSNRWNVIESEKQRRAATDEKGEKDEE